ncbi:hypothetical protein A7A08_02002 [Methyloligella halotolerans]|uniref:DUF721 domain-containing protein n=2 Tax=Methyloligella halotolerans TaxID=1177755 RepID=A0A1E2RYR8_9HYPH|nr:hypothetical protein A7A08_02002 [Methyloligella halotolerans]
MAGETAERSSAASSGGRYAADPKRRAQGLKPLGGLAARALEPAARARGFTTMALLEQWASIVGAGTAKYTAPDRLIWPRQPRETAEDEEQPARKRPEGATLVLRVDGPRSIEVQYKARQIMERVNSFFGYRAVVEMRIKQAPVGKLTRPQRHDPLPPDPTVLPEDAEIEYELLRDALVRLGTAAKRSQNRKV